MSELERQFKGVWIPKKTWLDRGLSITEKVMMVEIGSLQDEHRGCFATNAHFAEFFDLSISRVSEIISGLAAKGLVDVEQIRQGKRIIERRIRVVEVEVDRRKPQQYTFDNPNTPSEKALNPFGKGDEPPSENTQGSNTSLNNTKNNTSHGASAPCDDGFEAAWKAYPKREGNNPKNKAYSCWKARLKDGVTAEEMMAGIVRYAAYCKIKGWIGTGYVMQAVRFFGTERAFDNEWKVNGAANKQSGMTKDFSNSTYQGTPNDQFAEIFQ